MKFKILLPALLLVMCGCQTSTIATRRQEKLAVYDSLSPEMRGYVDQGMIRVGMPADAVYIAWGPPQQTLESENESGHQTVWLYHATYLQETQYWNFREVSRDGTVYLDRFLDRAYDPQDYVSAEIILVDGKVKSWRTLPRPSR